MNIRGISADTLSLLLIMGQESHPREFAALLSTEDGVIRNVDIIPGTIGGSESASVLFEMIPLNVGYIGSAHKPPERGHPTFRGRYCILLADRILSHHRREPVCSG